jgi:putative ABC transport system permease protein
VIVLFLITGAINYLNLSLAELTASFKRMGVLRIFGGIAGSHSKIIFSDLLLSFIVVIPLTFMLSYLGWMLGNSYLSIRITPHVLFNPIFISVVCGVFILLATSSQVNAHMLSSASYLKSSLKGKLSAKESGAGVRKILVATQLSFSIIMIALIIIIVDQFHFIQQTDKGFEERNTLVVKLRSDNYSKLESFNEAIRKISGVTKVDGSSYYPGIVETKYVFQVETEKGMEQLLVPMMNCGYDYLDVLNIKLAEGRSFQYDKGDDQSGSFIINETAAKEFGWQNPIGKQIRGPITGYDEAYKEGKVIGVVNDFNFASMHVKIEPLIIFLQDKNWGSKFIYIKMNPVVSNNLIPAIQNEYKKHWDEDPLEWECLDSKYKSLYEKDYEVKSIFEIGLVISILICSLGIFSISALLVTLRTKEMGIRKVVGANTLQLFCLHTKSFLQFLIISIFVAWPVIWYLSNTWLQNFAYHIALNIWYFIIPGIIAFFITILTSGYHGIKIALVNPANVLKQE